MIWRKVSTQLSQLAVKKLDRNPMCAFRECVRTESVCSHIQSLCMFELHFFFLRWQLSSALASCWRMPPVSLTFRIIASCSNCQGSWRSEVRVNLSCCALAYKGRHLVLRSSWSSTLFSPNNSLPLLIFCILQHAVAGKRLFSAFQPTSLNTSLKNSRFLNPLFLNAVLPVLAETKHHLSSASAAMLTPVSERLVAASHLRTLFYWPWMLLTSKQQHHILIITAFSLQWGKEKKKQKNVHLILKLPSAKINWP